MFFYNISYSKNLKLLYYNDYMEYHKSQNIKLYGVTIELITKINKQKLIML